MHFGFIFNIKKEMKINKGIFLLPIFFILLYFCVFFVVIIIKRGDLSDGSLTKNIVSNNIDGVNIEKSKGYGYLLNEKYSNPFSPKFGNKNSKVSIVFFLDFDCPFCYEEYFHIKSMLKNHLNDAYFEFRQFPIEDVHENSRSLSNAVMCANEQNKFLEMFDVIFLDYKNRENGELTIDQYINDYAENTEIDLKSFNLCMKDLRYNKIINKDIVDALNLGLSGTPSFFVNGEKVEGIIKTDNWDKLFINK